MLLFAIRRFLFRARSVVIFSLAASFFLLAAISVHAAMPPNYEQSLANLTHWPLVVGGERQSSIAQQQRQPGMEVGHPAAVPGPTVKTPPPPPPQRLQNPLRVNTIGELLTAILNIIIVLALPIVVFFIIYAGFLFVTARGNDDKLTNAKRALLYAVIGGVLVLGAVAIAEIVRNVVAQFTKL
jgi:hypothetical protein